MATLTVRRAAVSEFERFEGEAARIMSRYDGRIERAIRASADPAQETFREVHIVSFRDQAAFESYRRDPELHALDALRASAIVSTDIISGADSGVYLAAPVDGAAGGA